MKFHIITTLLCLAPVVLADEVVLKDGTVYKDCVVEHETDKAVTILVPVGKTIKDSKTIDKDKIESIAKSTPDEREYSDIKRRYSDIDVLTDEEKTKALGIGEKFLETYKDSKLAPEVTKHVDSLKEALADNEEAADEAKGDAEAEEVDVRTAYDANAGKVLEKFKERMKQGKVIPAMVAFDELYKNYAASTAYEEARRSVEKSLPKLVSNLGKMKEAAEKKERDERARDSEKTMDFVKKKNDPKLTADQVKMVKDAEDKWRKEQNVKREVAKKKRTDYVEQVRVLREKGLKWFNPIPDVPESIRDLERIATSDMERIKNEIKYPDNDIAGKGSAALKEAWKNLDEGNLQEAEDALSTVKRTRVPEKYWEQLGDDLKKAKEAAREKEKADREAANEARKQKLREEAEKKKAAAAAEAEAKKNKK